MAKFEKFHFKSLEEVREKTEELNLNIHYSVDFSVFRKKVKIGNLEAANPFLILPLEGCDCERDGTPTNYVARRYHRFANGGAGVIWWEACAVVPEGKANERQMMLTRANLPEFKKLVAEVNAEALKLNGYRPINILQLTHSGRYSRPIGHEARPIIAQHDPMLDPLVGIAANDDSCLATDEYLDSLVDKYVDSARLAKEAGFDGVDVKTCHRYLLSELLASFTRKGKYGGSFENRTRLQTDIVKAIRDRVKDDSFIIAARMNVFDAHPYPYGFGADRENFWKVDPTEPAMLVKALIKAGVDLIGSSAGNTYYKYPYVARPLDKQNLGVPDPEEHPLESMERLMEVTRMMQEAAGDIPVVGSGYTWLRNYFPYVAAYNLKEHNCSLIGLGRTGIAYPDAPNDLFDYGKLDPSKCCITCSGCTQMMRDHGIDGCIVRDSELYGPIYRKQREEAKQRETRK